MDVFGLFEDLLSLSIGRNPMITWLMIKKLKDLLKVCQEKSRSFLRHFMLFLRSFRLRYQKKSNGKVKELAMTFLGAITDFWLKVSREI